MRRRHRDQLAGYQAEFQRGGLPDLWGLREMVDGEGGSTWPSAVVLLMASSPRAGTAEFTSDLPRLARAARDPRLGPESAASVAGRVAWFQISELMRARLKKVPVDEGRVADLAGLAEFACGKDPSALRPRYALAMARLLQDRPAAGRDLLVGLDADRAFPADRSHLFVVRALIELALGDPAASRRLVEKAGRVDGATSALLPVAKGAVLAAEKQVADQAAAAGADSKA